MPHGRIHRSILLWKIPNLNVEFPSIVERCKDARAPCERNEKSLLRHEDLPGKPAAYANPPSRTILTNIRQEGRHSREPPSIILSNCQNAICTAEYAERHQPVEATSRAKRTTSPAGRPSDIRPHPRKYLIPLLTPATNYPSNRSEANPKEIRHNARLHRPRTPPGPRPRQPDGRLRRRQQPRRRPGHQERQSPRAASLRRQGMPAI